MIRQWSRHDSPQKFVICELIDRIFLSVTEFTPPVQQIKYQRNDFGHVDFGLYIAQSILNMVYYRVTDCITLQTI